MNRKTQFFENLCHILIKKISYLLTGHIEIVGFLTRRKNWIYWDSMEPNGI